MSSFWGLVSSNLKLTEAPNLIANPKFILIDFAWPICKNPLGSGGNLNFKLLLPYLIGSIPLAYIGGSLNLEKEFTKYETIMWRIFQELSWQTSIEFELLIGTPITGKVVKDAITPAKWAAPPAPAIITLVPLSTADSENSAALFGVLWADIIETSFSIPK